MPYKGYKKENRYDVIMFTTSKKKSFPLEEDICKNSVKRSRVRKRPENVGKGYIKKELSNHVVKNKIDKTLLKFIKMKKPKKEVNKKKQNSVGVSNVSLCF